MNAEVAQAIAEADWTTIGPRLQLKAHDYIARYTWRGLKVTASSKGRLSIGDCGPEDFITEALNKLVRGTRAYRADLTVYHNIRLIVKSDINNYWKKTNRRLSLVDRTAAQAYENPIDPIESIPDTYETDSPQEAVELRQRQRELLDGLSKSVADDDELSLVLMAYEDGKRKTAEIASETGIAANRVSELKRKLQDRADKFIRTNLEYKDLKPLRKAL